MLSYVAFTGKFRKCVNSERGTFATTTTILTLEMRNH